METRPTRWILHLDDDEIDITQEEKDWFDAFTEKHDVVSFWITEWEEPPPLKPVEEWTQMDWIMHGMAQSYLDNLKEGQNILASLMERPENQGGGNYVKYPLQIRRNRDRD